MAPFSLKILFNNIYLIEARIKMTRISKNRIRWILESKISILICLLFFYGCKSKSQEKGIPNHLTSNSIVLITDGLTKPGSVLVTKMGPLTIVMPDLSYLNNQEQEVILPMDYGKTRNTFLLNSKSKDIILNYRISAAASIQYLLSPGDTVILSNKNGKPLTRRVNEKRLEHGFDYEMNYLGLRPSMKMYNVSSLYYISSNGVDVINKSIIQDKSTYSKQLINKLNDEKIFLDSLKNIKAISTRHYNFYNNRNKYLALSIKIDLGLTNSELINMLKDVKKDTLCSSYPFYTKLVQLASNKLYVDNLPLMRSIGNIHKDNRLIFDKISGDTLILLKVKNKLLEEQLERIAENFPKQNFDKYFGIFQKLTNDTAAVNRIREKYLLDYSQLQHDVNNINLINSSKKKETFLDIKKASTGRVLYVDFWASWCAPCRQEMPASFKLRTEYKGKKIDFIYLSTDNNYNKWIDAAKAEKLINYPFSYLLLNSATSNELLSLQIKTIPRYLIFNKKGELVSKNAPAPSSSELKKLLDKYLAE